MQKLSQALCICVLLLGCQAFGQSHFRLVGFSNYAQNQVYDSLRLTYSGSRGGFVNVQNYNSPYVDTFNADTLYMYHLNQPTLFIKTQRVLSTYSQNGNLQHREKQSYDTVHTLWLTTDSMQYFYDGNNRVKYTHTLQFNFAYAALVNANMHFYRYDAGGRLVADSSVGWVYDANNIGSWENEDWNTYSYDQDGNLIMHYDQYWSVTGPSPAWRPSIKYHYTFGSNNRCLDSKYEVYWSSSASWKWSHRDSNSYNSQGQRSSVCGMIWDTSCACWKCGAITSFSYNSAGDVVLDESEVLTGAQFWRKNWKDSFVVDANHDRIAIYQFRWINGYTFYGLREASYTSDHQPLKIWDSTVNGAYVNNYYYEMYFPAGVRESRSVVADLNLFPSPADQFITVSCRSVEVKEVIFSITDVTGILKRQWTATIGINYKNVIPVSDLAAGNHFLTISDKTARTTRQFTIVR